MPIMARASLAGALILLSAIPAVAQNAAKTIALTMSSNASTADALKALQKGCPNVTSVGDSTKSDYAIEVIKKSEQSDYDVTLFEHGGKVLARTSNSNLGNAVQHLISLL
jgi:GrpB-like predicted nucleotidyltransferase (UPF0157 family)